MPKLAEAKIEGPTENGQLPLMQPGEPITPTERAMLDEDHRVDDALRPLPFAKYLLARKAKQRLGRRKSFSDNFVARYLADQLGGEWLATPQQAMNGETMQTYQLPSWLAELFVTIGNQNQDDQSVTRNELVDGTLAAIADYFDGADQVEMPVLE